MEKLVYALWRPSDTDLDPWADRVRDAGEALLDRGARGVQVNVADTDVARAVVRMSTFAAPIEATVAVWLDTATGPTRTAVEAALTAVAERTAGWLVTESVPLEAPATGAGERTPGFANLAFLRCPAHLDRTEWLDRWQGSHTAVALETQRTLGYVQNVVVRPVTEGAPAVDGIVEELFPIEALTDFHVFFDTGGSDDELGRRMSAMTTSVAHFSGEDAPLDVVPTSRYVLASPFA